jgi:hypothetical protein
MNCWYCCRRIGALLAEISILGVGGAESVAGGVVLLMSGKWTVLSQKSDLEDKQDTCGMLRARSTRLVWGGSAGSTEF